MSIGNTFENELMTLIFCATSISAVAQNASATPLAVLWYSLHTADPGEAGDQTTSETNYTSYGRVSVARTTVGHIVTNNSVSPGAAVSFPACTGGSGTITHAVVGRTSSGAGEIFFSGTVTPNISVSNGVTPRLTTASAITID